ncbi:hypothetical protein [Mesorhizobium sp.]|uniref:hypothetical protein n=1 Tax=Mesorhizobium sp. TaxID=1871066 RepID=UPI000FE46E02|nr:hypothetical protein [Mesorhizobium sp.]RWI87049.1 MAG: hypothetical protein EOR21_28580 [Mesorhizobium sp.]
MFDYSDAKEYCVEPATAGALEPADTHCRPGTIAFGDAPNRDHRSLPWASKQNCPKQLNSRRMPPPKGNVDSDRSAKPSLARPPTSPDTICARGSMARLPLNHFSS